MTSPPEPRWRRLETLGMDAFPAMVEENRDGCVFRAAGGFNFRNSSVTLLEPGAISPERLIAETRAFCAAHAIAPVLRMPLLWPEVEAALAAAGWERFRDCHVLDRSLDALTPAARPGGDSPVAAAPPAVLPPGAIPHGTATRTAAPVYATPAASTPSVAPTAPPADRIAPTLPAVSRPGEASPQPDDTLSALQPIDHAAWLAQQLGGRGVSAEDAERMRAVYARLPASAERLGWWPHRAETDPGAPPPTARTPADPQTRKHRSEAPASPPPLAADIPVPPSDASAQPPTATALLVHDGPDVALMNMLVAPEARGSGTGRRMLRALMAHAAGQGRRRMWLQVLSTNAAALALYRSEGFEPVYDYAYWRPAEDSAPEAAPDIAPAATADRTPRP